MYRNLMKLDTKTLMRLFESLILSRVKASDGQYTTTSPTWTFRTLNVSMDLRYTYDADNRIIEKYEQSWMTNYQPEVTYYQYDPAGRLTEVQYPWGITESYQYDPAGNRISLTNSETGTTRYTYDEENKLLYTNHSGNLTYYDYDNTGNTISVTSPNGNTTYYTYDYERRLISVTLPNNINITYAYLPNGDRIMRQNDTETTYYLYDREDRIADYDPSGNLITAYTHGPGIDEPVAMTLNNSTYFYIPDIQGSIRAIVDTQGNAVATYQYDAWGNLVSYGGPMAEKNDYLYTGREYDWQTGVYYYRARYYNPELGRFLSQDPAGMVDGPNMYVYVKNNPVNGVDPSGMVTCEECKIGIGALCAAGITIVTGGLFAEYDIVGIFVEAGLSKFAAGGLASILAGSLDSLITLGTSFCFAEGVCALLLVCPIPNYQAIVKAGVISVTGNPFPPVYIGSGGGGGRLGIRPMVSTGTLYPIIKPHPLPIAPIGSPFWRATI